MTVPNPKTPGHMSEFQYDPALKHWLGDSCGDAMSAHMEAMADGRLVSVGDMLSIYNDLHNRNIAHVPGKGGSTLSQQKMELEARGYKSALYYGYEDPFKADWLTALRTYAGQKPIGLFFTDAQYLVDAVTGIGYSYRIPWKPDFAKHPLHGHFIAVIAKCNLGYICCDGANPQANQRYQVYRADTLAKAGVHGLLMIEMRNAKPAEVLPYHVAPDGNLVYAAGVLGPGYSAYVKAHNITTDLEMPDTGYSPTENFCLFRDGRVLYYSPATGVLDMGNCGRIVSGLWHRPVPTKEVVPADVTNALKATHDYLNQSAPLLGQIDSAMKKAA